MVTFKTSKAQERSYYVLGIVVLVHVLIAIALSFGVFLYGPNAVFRIVAMGVVLLLMPATVYPSYKLYCASAGKDIYGYFVLTTKTLAVKLPGKPRQFFRRADCTGFSHTPWKRVSLVFRRKHVVELRVPGMGQDGRQEMVEKIMQTWWPMFFQGPAAELVLGDDGHPSGRLLEVRALFPRGGDGMFPILAYAPSFHAQHMMQLGLLRPVIVIALALTVFAQCVQMLGDEQDALTVWNLGLTSVASVTTALTFGVLFVRAAIQISCDRATAGVFLLSRKRMQVFHRILGSAPIRPEALVDYSPETGHLRISNGKILRFAVPLSRQGPFSRLVYTALVYWDVERRPIWDNYLGRGESVVGECVYYGSLLLGSVLAAIAVNLSDRNAVSNLALDKSLLFGVLLLGGTLVALVCLLLVLYYAQSRTPIVLDSRHEEDEVEGDGAEC